MGDARIKHTFFYETKGKSTNTGWTETLWGNQPDLDTARANAKDYMTIRKNLLGIGAIALAWRGTLVPAGFIPPAPKRITQVYFFQGNEGVGEQFVRSPDDDYDPAHEDLLLSVQSAFDPGPPPQSSRRSMFLSGLPDSQTDQLKTQGMNAPYLFGAQMSQFIKELTGGRWYNRKKTGAGPPATFTAYPISRVQPIMVRHRNRGRTFFPFRGRRLA